MSLSNQSSPSPLTFKCGRVLWERNASLGFGLMRRGRGLEYDVSVNPLHMYVCVCTRFYFTGLKTFYCKSSV